MEKREEIDQILYSELTLALGCTEPACAALSGARLRDELGAIPRKAKVRVSRDMMKNAMVVSIPNSTLSGIAAAVALGIATGESSRGLSVLSALDDEKRMIASDIDIDLSLVENVPALFIEVEAEEAGHSASVAIEREHDRFSRIVKDGREVMENPSFFSECDSSIENETLDNLSLRDVVEYADGLSDGVKDLLEQAYKTNLEISYAGLEEDWGLAVGRTMFPMVTKIESVDDAMRKAAALAASGSDARMSGCSLPVIINSGSGNQGLTVSLPVIEYAKEYRKSHEELVRALALSNLIAIHQKRYIGPLSAFCGAVNAATGAAAGICFLLGGSDDEIGRTITDVLANVGGIVCDGAKPSCAAKISSALEAAILSYEMTTEGNCFKRGEGLVGCDIEKTIESFGRVGREGMRETDAEILRIMLEE